MPLHARAHTRTGVWLRAGHTSGRTYGFVAGFPVRFLACGPAIHDLITMPTIARAFRWHKTFSLLTAPNRFSLRMSHTAPASCSPSSSVSHSKHCMRGILSHPLAAGALRRFLAVDATLRTFVLHLSLCESTPAARRRPALLSSAGRLESQSFFFSYLQTLARCAVEPGPPQRTAIRWPGPGAQKQRKMVVRAL